MTDDRLRATITRGKPGTAMRPFPMKDQQLTDLVAYLQTLAPPE
jgi:cytochrome c1